jgi:O-antigen biosynthesis protein
MRIINKNNPLALGKGKSYYGFVREDILDTIAKSGIQTKRILEIGCAGGAMGKRMKEIFPVEYYVGLELSEDVAEMARQHLDRVITADIEKVDLADDFGLDLEDFDLVLALDVLEHLYNPWDVLADLKQYLKTGGHVVASIPNVQNLAVIGDLIKGRWRYTDAGILDAAHIRFFTLEGISPLFEGAGLSLKCVNYTLVPDLDLSTIKDTGNSIRNENVNITGLTKQEILQFFVYQYIVVAGKS